MTFSAIVGLIAGIGAILSGVVYLVKLGVRKFTKTPEETQRDIDSSVDDEESQVDKTGRPV